MDEWALLFKLKTEKRTSFISGKISVIYKMNKPGLFEYYKSLFQWFKINVIDLFYSRK